MEMNETTLFKAIHKLAKPELIKLLEEAYHNTDSKTQRYIFGDLYNEITKNDRTPENLLEDIKLFQSQSLLGHYYASFRINSRNFSNIPEETDEWFAQISDYLDFVSELVKTKNYEVAAECFKILFDLIDKMEDGEEIVFADELGDWMIVAKSDYTENYIIALTHSVSISEYVELLIPIIKSDSYFSFYKKVYQKVKKHASKEQLEAINKEVKAQSIKTKK